MAISNGWRASVVWGGRQKRMILLSRHISTTFKVIGELWSSVSKTSGCSGTAYLRNSSVNHDTNKSGSIYPDSLLAYKASSGP